MKLLSYVLNHKPFFWLLLFLVVFLGIFSFCHLGRLEYPTFKIKKATVLTTYPGATAEEVEREVTTKIEDEIQKMSQIDYIYSVSRPNYSLIYIKIRDNFGPRELPQVWDELRRKVSDVRPKLPEGVGPSKIGDDYGDVYGIYISISGKGYSADDLRDYADILKKDLLRVPEVAKVDFWGERERTIYVEFNRAKLANLGISQEQLFQTLTTSNLVASAGAVQIDDEYTRLRVTGGIDNVKSIGNLYVADKNGKLLRISDIADVKRGHAEPAGRIMYYNGQPAIGLGISIVDGGNVIRMGKAVKARLKELEASKPVGMQINYINYQSDDVQDAQNEFLINLIESVVIVVAILLLTMGWRGGLVIGLTLIMIMLGTFIGMDIANIEMQLISLGALIIALGMLVDNAIVIVDGYLVKTSQGQTPEDALKSIAAETQMPLLGATAVAILAFFAVGFNPGNIGEFCRSLFYVIAISLFLSWIMALTFTPILCLVLIKPKVGAVKQEVYQGRFYNWYRSILHYSLRHRYLVLLIMILGLAIAGLGATKVQQTFFPDSTRKQFYVDYWRSQASHVEVTAKDVEEIAAWIRTLPGVLSTTTFSGEGTLRFMLTYDYHNPSPDYGQILIDVDDYRKIDKLKTDIEKYIKENYPSSRSLVMRFCEGMAIPFKIEARFRGPDKAVLRRLGAEAKAIMESHGNTQYIRDDWRDPVKNVKLNYSEIKARETGISRKDLANALNMNFSGVTCGYLRENDILIPIIFRPVEAERTSIAELLNVRVWSSATGRSYSLAQACDGITTSIEDVQINHRDRVPTLTVQCSPITGTAAALQKQLEKKLEAIRLPPLYSLEWGGEKFESEAAQEGLRKLFPVSLLMMFLLVGMLFRTIREPIAAFSPLPFSLIGVCGGLLLLNLPFNFMALLGFLGLSGMMLKNSIVLLDQVNIERAEGKNAYDALVSASVSRLRSVTMAAGTTVLGVIPLLQHPFFKAMAATITFGLLIATVLTLVVVPVVYAILFRVKR